MLLALVSDLHANFEGLRALSDELAMADQVLCLGDYVGYYCQVNETLDAVRALNAVCVLGNHDSFLLNGCPEGKSPAIRFGIEYADRVIDDGHRRWLASLPEVWGGVVGERSFLMAHGSPWRPLEDYLHADSPALQDLLRFDFDVVTIGHTHRPLVRVESRPYLLNPGSVGQPRDNSGARASALLLDTETMRVNRIVREFDGQAVIRMAQQNGAGRWATKHLVRRA